jgi:hypothetical protein
MSVNMVSDTNHFLKAIPMTLFFSVLDVGEKDKTGSGKSVLDFQSSWSVF